MEVHASSLFFEHLLGNTANNGALIGHSLIVTVSGTMISGIGFFPS